MFRAGEDPRRGCISSDGSETLRHCPSPMAGSRESRLDAPRDVWWHGHPLNSSWQCSKRSVRRFNTLSPPVRGRIVSGTQRRRHWRLRPHLSRSAMLGRLLQMPGARQVLPFVRLSHAKPSAYGWFDKDGHRRTVCHVEGGEQGDPLMPLLFSIGIQSALEEVNRSYRRCLFGLPTVSRATPPQSVDRGTVE